MAVGRKAFGCGGTVAVLRGGHAGEPLEKVGEVGLGGEVELLGNFLKRERRTLVEQALDMEEQGGLDDCLGGGVCHTAGDLRQVAWAHPHPVGIEIDIVAVGTELLLEGEELAVEALGPARHLMGEGVGRHEQLGLADGIVEGGTLIEENRYGGADLVAAAVAGSGLNDVLGTEMGCIALADDQEGTERHQLFLYQTDELVVHQLLFIRRTDHRRVQNPTRTVAA